MRFALATCVVLFAAPAFACTISVGDVKFEQGDVTSTAVVGVTNAEAVLGKDAAKELKALAKESKEPVPVRVGSLHTTLVLKDALSEKGATFFKDTLLTIPGKTNTDSLVLQQELKRCL